MVSKSKLMVGLFAVVLVLSLAPSSFAQTNLTAFGNGSAAEASTNRTADTFDPSSAGAGILISGANIASSTLTTTELIITYPAAITSNGVNTNGGAALPAGNPISIQAATGIFSGVTISTIVYNSGIIRITLNSSAAATTASGSFRLVGVRIDASTITGTGPVNALLSLSSSSNNYILSTSSVAVITSLAAGISSVAIGPRLTTTTSLGTFSALTSGGTPPDAAGMFTLTEGAASLWRTAAQDPGATGSGTQIRLTFAGVPAGLTLTLAAGGSSGTPVASPATITATSLTSTITFGTALSMTAVDKVQIDVTAAVPASVTSLAAGATTVTATMFPIATVANDSSGVPTLDTGFPRFVGAESPALTIGNIVAATTNLLLPFAIVTSGFDTGLSISNTTADPFGGSGNGGATAGSGSLIVTLFPTLVTGGAGPSGGFTTSTTLKPGVGLSSDGTLASGANWRVNVSELATAAGVTFPAGYVFIQANFLNAHGAAYVYGPNFVSNAGVLVLQNTATTPRSGESGLNN